MSNVVIIRNSSTKPFDIFLADLTVEIEKCGFSILHKDKSDLTAFYRNEGISLPENYRHAMFQICKAKSSGPSLNANPERCVFVQKFMFIYSKGNSTEVRFLSYSKQLISELLGHNEFENGPSDDAFGARMEQTFSKMQDIIQAAL